jgi:hypothetical protein
VRFEWNDRKAAANWRKHEVSFDEAASIFLDPLSVTGDDPDHQRSPCDAGGKEAL